MDPTRIFNADESGFSLCPKTGKVLGTKGFKNMLEIKRGSEKDNLTVLVTFSADGRLCPPCIVYPYVKPPRSIAESMPPDWFLGKSDTGWMRSDVFFEYVANGLHQWIVDQGIKKPILFFVDGHRSHMSIELSKFCDENEIILYALPPNAMHLMQPADVALFKLLKEYWRQAVRTWYTQNEERTLTKADFAPVFEKALSNPNIPTHIRNGFRRCGLFPHDPEAVDYTKCVQNTLKSVQEPQVIEQSEDLSTDDFRSTYKVLKALQTNHLHQNANIVMLLEELKTFEKKHVKDENTMEISEYIVNHNGYLCEVENPVENSLIVNVNENKADDLQSDSQLMENGINDFNEQQSTNALSDGQALSDKNVDPKITILKIEVLKPPNAKNMQKTREFEINEKENITK